MNLSRVVLLVGLILFVTACDQARVPTANSGTGSVVGNGVVSYTNSVMSIEFDFPSAWILEESSDQRAVKLESVARGSDRSVSILSFLIMDEYDGHTFENSAGLGAYLQQKFSLRSWYFVRFKGGQSGYFWQQTSGDRASAEFFALDSRGRILRIYYDASLSARGFDVVKRIIDSITVASSGEVPE